jgi:hypothetical protein
MHHVQPQKGISMSKPGGSRTPLLRRGGGGVMSDLLHGRGSGVSLLRRVALAAVLATAFLTLPAGAAAANVRESLPPITEANGAPIVNPFALTVDSGDHLFVTELTEPANVDKFGPTGSYETRTPEPLPSSSSPPPSTPPPANYSWAMWRARQKKRTSGASALRT